MVLFAESHHESVVNNILTFALLITIICSSFFLLGHISAERSVSLTNNSRAHQIPPYAFETALVRPELSSERPLRELYYRFHAHHSAGVHGWATSFSEFAGVYRIAALVPPGGNIFHVGARGGATTSVLAAAAPPGVTVHAFECWDACLRGRIMYPYRTFVTTLSNHNVTVTHDHAQVVGDRDSSFGDGEQGGPKATRSRRFDAPVVIPHLSSLPLTPPLPDVYDTLSLRSALAVLASHTQGLPHLSALWEAFRPSPAPSNGTVSPGVSSSSGSLLPSFNLSHDRSPPGGSFADLSIPSRADLIVIDAAAFAHAPDAVANWMRFAEGRHAVTGTASTVVILEPPVEGTTTPIREVVHASSPLLTAITAIGMTGIVAAAPGDAAGASWPEVPHRYSRTGLFAVVSAAVGRYGMRLSETESSKMWRVWPADMVISSATALRLRR
eukprot:TRINITY_DN23558_c0_g1_i1.p1 TRINITY_DN23558_c0_g1~~TRINITY_DN23558_c0_g1_i1.p1  ORF type:complete len:442 (+),score=9.66 TRINITY_DN23558_c0_g1_i1:89-1414(+)